MNRREAMPRCRTICWATWREMDLKSVRLQQYKDLYLSVMMLFCIGIALIFGWRLMRDVTGPIRNGEYR